MFQSTLRSFSRPVDCHVLHSVGSKRPCRFGRYHYAATITKRPFSSFVPQNQNEGTTHSEAEMPAPSTPAPSTPASSTPAPSTPTPVKNGSTRKFKIRSFPSKSKKKVEKDEKELQGPANTKRKSITNQEKEDNNEQSTFPVRKSGVAPRKSGVAPKKSGVAPKKSGVAPAKSKSKTSKIIGLGSHISERSKGYLDSKGNEITPLDIETSPVPNLSFGLDRVIFNPGVYQLRDPRTRIYNFDPYLDSIMPVTEFDFEALKEYITSSKDEALIQLARDHNKKYVGSSSSMTGVLSHFHYLLSDWRPVNRDTVSAGFPEKLLTFTRLLRCPAAMFLHYKDGVYAIDADKEFDNANILMNLGKSMEKLLTLPKEEFERYRRSSTNKITAEEEQAIPEAYHYSTIGDFIMRSQLDGYDPRLPGTGMFDLKTRAVVSIRMDVKNFRKGMGYEIRNRFGMWESYEREYYDMIRAAFLKYSLQVRVGRMDGIFVAFHNIERIFGFQYIPLSEMDLALHGQTNKSLGDREFQLSLTLWNMILEKATAKYPGKSLRLHFETREGSTAHMRIWAEPVTSEEIKAIQEKNKAVIERYQREMLHPELFAQEEREAEQAAKQKWAEAETKTAAAEAEKAQEVGKAEEAEHVQEAEKDEEADEADETEKVILSTDSGTVTNEAESVESATSEAESAVTEEEKEEEEEAATTQAAAAAEKKEKERYPELMGMTLCITNRVNGVVVERPEKLKSSHRWSIHWELSELQNNKYLHDTYDAMKRRRGRTLAFRGEDESFFLTRLRRIAQAGRSYRAEQNRLDREHGVEVYQPVTSLSQKSKQNSKQDAKQDSEQDSE